jgi:hypothetical protein
MSSKNKVGQKRRLPIPIQSEEEEATTVPSFLIKIFEILNVL